MSLTTPSKIRELQRKLYKKAKQEPDYRFYLLYDKLYREDILRYAYDLARANQGAPGVDNQSFPGIEQVVGLERWLAGIAKDLRDKTYQPQPVRRVMIPKPGGGERPLGIPTIRDRVVQTAAKLVLEPIFEADMESCAYGYRPKRSGQDAVRKVHEHLIAGYTDVVVADLSKYFDTIPHCELMQCVARRIVDRELLPLIKGWLTVPVEERDVNGKRRLVGGKQSRQGTPQGGVISPLLANLYMNRFLKHWRQKGKGQQYEAVIVNYADDFVILSRGHAEEAGEWTGQVMTQIGLTLNAAKTSIKDAKQETFNFLGYTFGPQRYWKDGRWYTAAQPSDKAIGKLKQSVYDLLQPSQVAPWEEVRDQLNSKLRGWRGYFSYGSLRKAYREIDAYVYDRVRYFMRRRHQGSGSRGTRQFSASVVFGKLGVFRFQNDRLGTTARASL
jgi:RNA-directed DNA polymerase